MTRQAIRGHRRPMTIAIGFAVVSVLAACSSGGSSSAGGGATSNAATQNGGGAVAGQTVPTANLPVPQQVGPGEGQLNLIAWGGLHRSQVGQAVRAADRLPGEREDREQFG